MEPLLLVAPITALEFVGDFLLAGEGPNLAVYSLKSKSHNPQRTPHNVLRGCTIHGIKPRDAAGLGVAESLLCVFGSKALIVLKISITANDVNLSRTCERRELHDWIWDVQWLGEGAQAAAHLGIALGHNSVALYDYRCERVLKEVHCSEKCILYSAHLVGDNWDSLTLISGTVFNQLVIWNVSDASNPEGRIEPQRRISGHKGVIFSIFYEKQRGILASASDDRSLRVWKVGDLAHSDAEVQCLHVLYGHQSRVWSVRLLQDNMVSIGEDSACIVWSYSGDIIHRFKGHKGRGIRAVAVQDQLGWVATGGADFGIRLWHIKGRSSPSNGLLNLNFSSAHGIGAPKAIAMVDVHCLVVMTDMGGIYTYDFISKEWNFILEDENYRSYSLLDVFKSSSSTLCAIGNITGGVKVFSLSPVQTYMELKHHEGKVHSLTWVPPSSPSSETCNLFSSGPNGLVVWLQVKDVSGNVILASENRRFILPPCKHRWHTSIVFLPKEDLIVCGDRRGSLMLFPMKVAEAHVSSQNDHAPYLSTSKGSVSKEEHLSPAECIPQGEGPLFVLFGIHGKLGVTSVACQDGFVYSSGRDGFYRQLKVEGGQLIMLRKLKSYKGMEWIERLSFTPDGDLEILGFHSTDFVIWSARANEKLHCIPCGGGHRSWSYKKEGPTEVFAYIKSGDIFAYQSQPVERLQNVIKESLHGRELTCVKYAGTIKNSSKENLDILITGSEDTTVSVLSFNEVSRQICCLSTISDHLSSVKTLALARTKHEERDNDVFSAVLFTAGGRAEIEVYRVVIQESTGHVTCQVIHLASHRLDEHWDRVKNKHKMVKMDPETRYMSLRALDEISDGRAPASACLYLAAACSDGSVRFFVMCERSRRMILAAETCYHQRCVLKVETFVHQSANCSRVMLCSAATDGRIAFWDITSTIGNAGKMLEKEHTDIQPQDLGAPCFTVSAHQCGINSLHVRKNTAGHYMVASGGDDNSVHVCWLTLDHVSEDCETRDSQLLKSFSAASAHAAHVTGLRILREDLLVSVSVDQRLILWGLGDSGLRHMATRFCHVADVSELDCWERSNDCHLCALCGQGLEIVRLKH